MSDGIEIDGYKFSGGELVDYKIAAKILGLAPRTVQNLGVARILPVYKIGTRSNRYRIRELLEWVDARYETEIEYEDE